jgi:hypothetical protein
MWAIKPFISLQHYVKARCINTTRCRIEEEVDGGHYINAESREEYSIRGKNKDNANYDEIRQGFIGNNTTNVRGIRSVESSKLGRGLQSFRGENRDKNIDRSNSNFNTSNQAGRMAMND